MTDLLGACSLAGLGLVLAAFVAVGVAIARSHRRCG